LLVGAVRLRRPYCYCERCHLGTAPRDEALQQAAGRQQPDVQKAAVKLTKERPYETSCELFEELTELPLNGHTAHEGTQDVAMGLGGHLPTRRLPPRLRRLRRVRRGG